MAVAGPQQERTDKLDLSYWGARAKTEWLYPKIIAQRPPIPPEKRLMCCSRVVSATLMTWARQGLDSCWMPDPSPLPTTNSPLLIVTRITCRSLSHAAKTV